MSEILVVGVAASLKAPLPLLPLQILFLNVLTDVFPALALAAGEANPGIMNRRPRPRSESFMTKRHWKETGVYGVVMTASVLGAMFLAARVFHLDERQSVTVSFLTLGFAQLWHGSVNGCDRGVGVAAKHRRSPAGMVCRSDPFIEAPAWL